MLLRPFDVAPGLDLDLPGRGQTVTARLVDVPERMLDEEAQHDDLPVVQAQHLLRGAELAAAELGGHAAVAVDDGEVVRVDVVVPVRVVAVEERRAS